MPRKDNFVSYSAEEAANLASEADWAKVAATSRDTIEQQMLDDVGPLPEGWEKTVVIGVPEPRQAINIRLDAEVLRWFKAHGPGYQTRINAVLRAFVSAKQREEHADAPSKGGRGNRSRNRSRSAVSPAA
jgi:uncharacterized protein (DUF4415 family)